MAAHPAVSRSIRFLALACGLALGACTGPSTLDRLDGAAAGSPFARALYENYAHLARSLEGSGIQSPHASGGGWFWSGTTESLAETFAAKAVHAAQGGVVEPEFAPSGVAGAAEARARLLNAFQAGAREQVPAQAARAQAGYDCWVLNAQVPAQGAAAGSCKAGLDGAIAAVEALVAPPARAAPAQATYTVYFGFDEWHLTSDALQVITDAMVNARNGGQSRIDIVGHTDTSGRRSYNQQLSERRANVVRDVMVQMGARPEAIFVRGVGEDNLAVQTRDGVREPGNRRSVVDLVP